MKARELWMVGVGCAAIVMLISGCATMSRDWQAAKATDTVAAYELFITKHPRSEHDSTASRRIKGLREAQAWNAAESAGSIDGYKQYIARYPSGKHIESAQQKMAEFQRYAPKEIEDQKLKAQGLGGVNIKPSNPQAALFVLPWPGGVTMGEDDRVNLRDALLSASPVKTEEPISLKPGRYIVALKMNFPRDSAILFDLGGQASGNLLVPPSKDTGYEFVVGGGIEAGALFKKVEDIYLTYGGALFADGKPVPNPANIQKYNYIRLQGTKDMMFRFVKDEAKFELWLISECQVKPGIIWSQEFRVPEQ